MAVPVDFARAVTPITTAATPWNCTMPASIATDDLLVMLIRTGGPQTVTLPGGWTALIDNSVDDGSDDVTAVYWKKALGGEAGAINIAFSAASKGVCIIYQVKGAATSAPTIGFSLFGGLSGTSHIFSDCNFGTVSDYLWIAFVALDNEGASIPTPSGFTNAVNNNSGTGGAVTTNACVHSSSLATTTEFHMQPPTVTSTVGASSGYTAVCIGIYPEVPPPPAAPIPVFAEVPQGRGAVRV